MPNFADVLGWTPNQQQTYLNDPYASPFLKYLLTGRNVMPSGQQYGGLESLLFGNENANASPVETMARDALGISDALQAQSNKWFGQGFMNVQNARDGKAPPTLLQPFNNAITPEIPEEVMAQGPMAVRDYVSSKSPVPLLTDIATGMADPSMLLFPAKTVAMNAARNAGKAAPVVSAVAKGLDVADKVTNPVGEAIGATAKATGLDKAIGKGVGAVKDVFAPTKKAIFAREAENPLQNLFGSTFQNYSRQYAEQQGLKWDDLTPDDRATVEAAVEKAYAVQRDTGQQGYVPDLKSILGIKNDTPVAQRPLDDIQMPTETTVGIDPQTGIAYGFQGETKLLPEAVSNTVDATFTVLPNDRMHMTAKSTSPAKWSAIQQPVYHVTTNKRALLEEGYDESKAFNTGFGASGDTPTGYMYATADRDSAQRMVNAMRDIRKAWEAAGKPQNYDAFYDSLSRTNPALWRLKNDLILTGNPATWEDIGVVNVVINVPRAYVEDSWKSVNRLEPDTVRAPMQPDGTVRTRDAAGHQGIHAPIEIPTSYFRDGDGISAPKPVGEAYIVDSDIPLRAKGKISEVALPYTSVDDLRADVREVIGKQNPAVLEYFDSVAQQQLKDNNTIAGFDLPTNSILLQGLEVVTKPDGSIGYKIPALVNRKNIPPGLYNEVTSERIRPKYLANTVVDAETARGFMRDVAIPHELGHGIQTDLGLKSGEPGANLTIKQFSRNPDLLNLQAINDELAKAWRESAMPIEQFKDAFKTQIDSLTEGLKRVAVQSFAIPEKQISVGFGVRTIGDETLPTATLRFNTQSIEQTTQMARALQEQGNRVDVWHVLEGREKSSFNYGAANQGGTGLKAATQQLLRSNGITVEQESEIIREVIDRASKGFQGREVVSPATASRLKSLAPKLTDEQVNAIADEIIKVASKGEKKYLSKGLAQVTLRIADSSPANMERLWALAKVSGLDAPMWERLEDGRIILSMIEPEDYADDFFANTDKFLGAAKADLGAAVEDAQRGLVRKAELPAEVAPNAQEVLARGQLSDYIDETGKVRRADLDPNKITGEPSVRVVEPVERVTNGPEARVVEPEASRVVEPVAEPTAPGGATPEPVVPDATGTPDSVVPPERQVVPVPQPKVDEPVRQVEGEIVDDSIGRAEQPVAPTEPEKIPLIPLTDKETYIYGKYGKTVGKYINRYLGAYEKIAADPNVDTAIAIDARFHKQVKTAEDALQYGIQRGIERVGRDMYGVTPDAKWLKNAKWFMQLMREQWIGTGQFPINNAIGNAVNLSVHGMNPLQAFQYVRKNSTMNTVMRTLGDESAPVQVRANYLMENGKTTETATGQIPMWARSLGLAFTFGMTGGPVGAIAGAAAGTVWPKFVQTAMHLSTEIEYAFRSTVWFNRKVEFLQDYLKKAEKVGLRLFDGDIARNPAEAQLNAFIYASRLNNYVGMVSPTKVYQKAIELGLGQDAALSATKAWREILAEGDRAGIEEANHILLNYEDSRKIDDVLRAVMPFVTWPTRMPLWWAKHIWEKPEILYGVARYAQATEQNNEREGLPKRFDMTFRVPNPTGDSDLYLNPKAVLGPLSQIRPTYEEEDTTPLGQAINTFKSIGYSPWPWIDIPLQAAGVYGTKGFSDVSTYSPLIQSASTMLGNRIEPEAYWKEPAKAIQQVVTGEKPTSITGDTMRDYQVQKRIAELSVQDTGKPNDPKYVAAMTDPKSAIWKRAEKELASDSTGLTAARLVGGVSLKQLTPTEKAVSKAKATLPETQFGPDGKPIKTVASKEAFEKASEANPLINTYSAVGDSKQAQVLSAQLSEYNSLGDERDREVFERVNASLQGLDGYARYRFLNNLNPDVFQSYNKQLGLRNAYKQSSPMLQQYLSWIGSVMRSESPVEQTAETVLPDTSIGRFLNEFGQPARSGDPVSASTGQVQKPVDSQTAALKEQLNEQLDRLGGPNARLTITALRVPNAEMGRAYLSWKQANPGRSMDEFLTLWSKYRAQA
jgi:hypothetical protein